MFFIVWVGGVADYEGSSKKEAEAVRNSWVALGYDDVILQAVEA
jgi:hypothetical protein